MSIGIVGFGRIGRELGAQLTQQREELAREGLELVVVAVARSRSMWLASEGEDILGAVMPGGPPAATDEVSTDLRSFGEFLLGSPGLRVAVDCTADDAPAELFAHWLAAGISVVTANKSAGSGPLGRLAQIREAAAGVAGARFLYEATVGAGLPIMGTLRDLRRTGDAVERVEGVLSGTLSFLFGRLGFDVPLSAAVREAGALGLTEPDPREDLSGADVQRKVVILARECGLSLELDDVPVESLVPQALRSWAPSAEERAAGLLESFAAKLASHDAAMAERLEAAAARGEALRYVGVVDVLKGTAAVEVRSVPATHPFFNLQLSDNVIAISTRRYRERPLVVQGPGAGAEVTAGGVFADVLRAAT